MFTLAILIGIYSYSIFSLGILGLLYKNLIISFTLFFIFLIFYFFRKKISNINLKELKIPGIFLVILAAQAVINLIGALGPELSFDSLWYHLTLPKIFLENHRIFHIPGGLFYYSDMPKLTEMIYISSLSIFNEIFAKVIHYFFGLLTLIAIYKISKKFLNPKFSILACVIFYGNLIVGWQSTTAYIDFVRAFFELMAIWGLINWSTSTTKSSKKGWFIESAVMLGLAISSKLMSLATIPIFLLLILYLKGFKGKNVKDAFVYLCISIYVAIPWFLFSYLNTGNPIYPIFSSYVKSGFDISFLNPLIILRTFWTLFTNASDPISPVYIIFLPLILFFYKKLNIHMKIFLIYFLLSSLFWYFFIPAKESRYLLQNFAVLSVVVAYIVQNFFKDKFLRNLSLAIIIFTAVISILYRGVANSKYLPVIFGAESKSHFLTDNLNFNFGDFYDTDGYFKKHIGSNDKVLLYGFHNLYYVNFPFIDSSYVKKGDVFNYIAVQNEELPARFSFWKLIYSNPKTHVMLYSFGGQKWMY